MDASKPFKRNHALERRLKEEHPYLRKQYDKRVLIKIGGAVLVDDDLLASLAKDIKFLGGLGAKVTVIHGGGPQIGIELEKAGIPVNKVNGLRVTDEATLKVVEKVLAGDVNNRLVEAIQHAGVKAIGISGSTSGLLQAVRRTDDEVDYGFVGSDVRVDIAALPAAGTVAVVAPLGMDASGQVLNINADEAASALAVALKADSFALLTDTDGVKDADGKVLPQLTAAEVDRLVADGVIVDGMLPKVEHALAAVRQGVEDCLIVNGAVPHVVELELISDRSVGTRIVG